MNTTTPQRPAWLRTTAARRFALDALAASGAGWLGLHALHGALALRSLGARGASAEEVPRFGPWADELWERWRSAYALVAQRDSGVLNSLLPEGAWPPGIRLRVRRGEETIGWVVVMHTPMQGDARFGDLHVGSIIDCFGSPANAAAVLWPAVQFLRARGVDLIVSNQAHPDWVAGFERCGFLALAGRRLYAASPALREALEPVADSVRGIHLTNLDGHGPLAL